jgi:hypothetical protein
LKYASERYFEKSNACTAHLLRTAEKCRKIGEKKSGSKHRLDADDAAEFDVDKRGMAIFFRSGLELLLQLPLFLYETS